MSAKDFQLTPAQIAAAKMRKMAKDLLLQAEALEATAPERPKVKVNFDRFIRRKRK